MTHDALKLTTENSEQHWRFKIGTTTPKVVWVHEDDFPLESGKHVRYTERDLEEDVHDDYHAEADIGYIKEIRDGVEKVCFIRPGGMLNNIKGFGEEE